MEQWKETPWGIIPSTWKISTVKEETSLVTDYVANGSFASLAENVKYKSVEDYAILIRLVDYNNNFQGPFVFIDESAYEFLAKSKLYGNEIIISNVGANVGTVFKCPKLKWKMSLAPNSIMVKFKGNNDFYYYWLKSKFGQHMLNSIVTGSAQPKFNKTNFKDLAIPVPPIDEQKRIAAILSSLDDKIELNRRINRNLEQQAQALYAKAFSSTNTCKMGDVVETTSGGTPSRKNQNYFSSQGIKWIKSKELNGSFIFDSEEHISDDGLCNSSAKLLPPNSTLIAMYGATVGAYGLTIDDATCNQAICALLPNSQYPYTYLYMWAKNNKDELIQKAIGSAQQNISQIIIKNMPVANEKDKIIRFDSDTRYIFSLMKSLAKENRNLIALRDALLPRLMSGELKINDLNR